MLNTIAGAIKGTLSPYVQSLLDGMPKSCKLPRFDYGSAGALGFYQLTLKEIMSYKDLQTEVFHAFREIGNGVLIFLSWIALRLVYVGWIVWQAGTVNREQLLELPVWLVLAYAVLFIGGWGLQWMWFHAIARGLWGVLFPEPKAAVGTGV